MDCFVCELKKEDLTFACEIEKSSFSTPWSMGAIESEFLSAHSKLIGIKDADGLVGWGAVRVVSGVGEITNIVIKEPMRGRGLSKILLKDMLLELFKMGAREVFLEVRSQNSTAINLYEKNGFLPVGMRRGYYIKPSDDAVVMKREMRDFADTCP